MRARHGATPTGQRSCRTRRRGNTRNARRPHHGAVCAKHVDAGLTGPGAGVSYSPMTREPPFYQQTSGGKERVEYPPWKRPTLTSSSSAPGRQAARWPLPWPKRLATLAGSLCWVLRDKRRRHRAPARRLLSAWIRVAWHSTMAAAYFSNRSAPGPTLRLKFCTYTCRSDTAWVG